jgi:hypothetical protein
VIDPTLHLFLTLFLLSLLLCPSHRFHPTIRFSSLVFSCELPSILLSSILLFCALQLIFTIDWLSRSALTPHLHPPLHSSSSSLIRFFTQSADAHTAERWSLHTSTHSLNGAIETVAKSLQGQSTRHTRNRMHAYPAPCLVYCIRDCLF